MTYINEVKLNLAPGRSSVREAKRSGM